MTAKQRKPKREQRSLGWRRVKQSTGPWCRSHVVLSPDDRPVFRGTARQCLAYCAGREVGGSHEEAMERAFGVEPEVQCAHIPLLRFGQVLRDPACRAFIPAGSGDYCLEHQPLHPGRPGETQGRDGITRREEAS